MPRLQQRARSKNCKSPSAEDLISLVTLDSWWFPSAKFQWRLHVFLLHSLLHFLWGFPHAFFLLGGLVTHMAKPISKPHPLTHKWMGFGSLGLPYYWCIIKHCTLKKSRSPLFTSMCYPVQPPFSSGIWPWKPQFTDLRHENFHGVGGCFPASHVWNGTCGTFDTLAVTRPSGRSISRAWSSS